MAEIELGTIGSPEITLILNGSNNLEFQDSDGNVISTFKQDQSAEFDSLSTEELQNSGSPVDIGDLLNWTDISKGSTLELARSLAADSAGIRLVGQPTDGVSTSATTILNPFQPGGGSAAGAGVFVVWGDERASTNRFADLLLTAQTGAGTSVVASNTENSPAGRTYGRDAGGVIQLTMGSGTYDVTAVGVVASRATNAQS